ncbi:MAG: hypothetical protein CM1200mP26_24370 [Acidimicrobiales bacterium]|nr:MAG: hypothetical protein CM1200mP26_24370 [Acidimicrobiales bacterium]
MGCDQVVFGLPTEGLTHDQTLEMIELFGDQVIPEYDRDRTHSTDRSRGPQPSAASQTSSTRCPKASTCRSSRPPHCSPWAEPRTQPRARPETRLAMARDGSETRARLLVEAERLFAEVGVWQAATGAIVRAAGQRNASA